MILMRDVPVEEYWEDIRRGTKSRSINLKTSMLGPILSWMKKLDEPVQVIPGKNREELLTFIREEIYDNTILQVSSLKNDILTSIVSSVGQIQVPIKKRNNYRLLFDLPVGSNWEILWYFVAIDDLCIPIIESNWSKLHDFYVFFNDIRFEAKKMSFLPAIEESITILSQWIDEKKQKPDQIYEYWNSSKYVEYPNLTIEERLDLLMFILKVASYNQLLDNVIIYLNIPQDLSASNCNQLFTIIKKMNQWKINLGILLGFEDININEIKGKHPKLALELKKGMLWFLNLEEINEIS